MGIKTHKLFVYGTLKSGSNRSISQYEGATLIDKDYTIIGYTLFQSPISNAPIMVKSPLDFVKGELWSVSDKTITELDKREGYKGKWYNRLFSWYKRKIVEAEIHSYVWTFPTIFLKQIGYIW